MNPAPPTMEPEYQPIPDILKTAESGKAEDLHAELRTLSDSSLYYFSKVVLNYRDLTEGYHLPFCERIQEDEAYTTNGYLLARATFKSTIRTKSYMLWKYLKNHEERFLNIGESDTVAKKALVDIKWHIMNNQFLRWLYPELLSVDPQVTKWTDSEILLPREGTYDEPSITCDGVGAKRTGFHYTEIIFDDIIGEKAAASPAIMDAAWEWIQYSRGLLHDPAKSRRTFNGTRWKHGNGDIYGRVMEHMPECRWYIRSAIENDKPTFPERLSLKTLAEIRDEQKDYKFNCQYMNNPTAPGGADFEADWLQEYDVADDGKLIIPRDGSPAIKTNQLLRMSFFDVSSGGKTAECENAQAFGGMTSDKRIIILESWSRNCTIGQAVENWHQLNDRWKCYHNHYELVGAQKAVEDFCQERTRQRECPYCNAGHLASDGKLFLRNPHIRINPIGIKPAGGSMNKEDRIRMFAQKAIEEKRVYLRRGVMIKLRTQIIQFPHSDMIDEFDAVAYLINLLRAPLAQEEEESQEADRTRAKLGGKPRTHTSRDYGGY